MASTTGWLRRCSGLAVGTISASMRALRPFGEFIVANVLHVPGTVYDLTSHTLLPNANAATIILVG